MADKRHYAVGSTAKFEFTLDTGDGEAIAISIPEPSVGRFLNLHDRITGGYMMLEEMEQADSGPDPDTTRAKQKMQRDIWRAFITLVPKHKREYMALMSASQMNEMIIDFQIWQANLVAQAVKKKINEAHRKMPPPAETRKLLERLSRLAQHASSATPDGNGSKFTVSPSLDSSDLPETLNDANANGMPSGRSAS